MEVRGLPRPRWEEIAAGVRLLHSAVDLVCDRNVLSCALTATLQLENSSELTIERPVVLRSMSGVLDVDAAASTQVRSLAPGARAEIVIKGTLHLDRHDTKGAGIPPGCPGATITPPINVRHLVLVSRGHTVAGTLQVPGGAVVTTSGRPASPSFYGRDPSKAENRQPAS